jgi:ech hydrogenase subunit A
MGKLVSNANAKEQHKHMFHIDEEIPIFIQAVLVVVSCFTFPAISKYALIPYLSQLFGESTLVPIGSSDVSIMLFMLSMLLILPISFIPLHKKDKRRLVPIYMSGENTGDNESFYGAIGATKKVEFHNWYMESTWGSKKLSYWSNIVAIAILCVGVILLIGGFAK